MAVPFVRVADPTLSQHPPTDSHKGPRLRCPCGRGQASRPGNLARVTDDPRTEDLGFARVDLDRARRTGDAEVVYGAGKQPQQIVDILSTLHERHPERAVLATR